MDLYTDWLLNVNIQQKFKAFKQGFNLVMSQSCLADLVIAEELELIICGSSVSTGSWVSVELVTLLVLFIVTAGVGH